MTIGNKIIEGLKEAQRGDFGRVTIEGQTWVKKEEIAQAIESAAKVVESGDYDGDTFDLLAAAIRALKSD